ncbi:MAG: ABC transporter ATP-binding protein, partial [Coriobacteriia bacterium]|nr:ABC transporter ATP-binding protein [Coriobacteriia bacterium]
QRDVRNLILALRERGMTVLLSSHQLSEVEAVCDRVSILNRGVVAAEGRIDDLLNAAGQTSIRARGEGADLPSAISDRVSDVAVSGGVWVFSVADADVRLAVDALDDAGWGIVSISPKRDTLEDYFTRLLRQSAEEVA